MKKVLVITKFISDSINALIGILAAIGFIELINVIISFYIGEYVRLDSGNLETIKEEYISFGLYGYAIAWIFIYCNRIAKDENKDIIQKSKKVIIISWIIMVVANFVCGIILSDLIGALNLNVMFSFMFGLALLFLYIYDKKVINEINKKIKENTEKES